MFINIFGGIKGVTVYCSPTNIQNIQGGNLLQYILEKFKSRHLRGQQGNLQFCYHFSSVLPQIKGLPVPKSQRKNITFQMLITPERKVPQRSDASQNDHKSKGYPSKTFTMQKADKGDLRRLARPPLK